MTQLIDKLHVLETSSNQNLINETTKTSMQNTDNEKLRSFTIDLSRQVTEISDKIKNQSIILESVKHQAKNNDESFKKNQDIFLDVLRRLDNDKRNLLIVFLLAIISVLIYILRS